MIIIETFRIPGGVVGALSAFLFSRENLVSTARSAFLMMAAFLIGALFIPIGARFLASTPETHFFWVALSLFIVFFLLRCLANYGVAIGLALVVSNVVAIWYLPGPPERNVELTLWNVEATIIGALVTLGVEVVFRALYKRDDLIEGIDTRLALIEDQMASLREIPTRYAGNTSWSRAVRDCRRRYSPPSPGPRKLRTTLPHPREHAGIAHGSVH